MHLRRAGILTLVCVGLLRPTWARGDGSDSGFFEKKIRPVLVESCYECHSSRAKELKGDLRLDSAVALKAGGETGPVVMPGAPEKSRLIDAIRYHNVDLQMPPMGRLAASKIDDLRSSSVTSGVAVPRPPPTVTPLVTPPPSGPQATPDREPSQPD